MMTPSLDQLAGLLRIILPTLLLWMAGRGWFAPDQVGTLTTSIVDVFTAIVTFGSLAWSLYANSKAKMISNVAAMPDVKKVVATEAIADGSHATDPKVTTQ